ncbi:MAG: glycosyltransferase family 4 protein [Bacteriovorax sp.]|jgi:glycosyltransferase involved in cell wall biosynthesis
MQKKNVLLFLEGNTDIRYIRGLAENSNLEIAIPKEIYEKNGGLKNRIKNLDSDIKVHTISAGRILFQLKSFMFLFKNIRRFDLVFSQENLRGTLNANMAGLIFNRPVYSFTCFPAVEYYACRLKRQQIGYLKYLVGVSVIRLLLFLNSKLTKSWIILGPYLESLYKNKCSHYSLGQYYGVDVNYFKPATISKIEIRNKLKLPISGFLVFFSSRVSHEKDPDSVLKAVNELNKEGHEVSLLNLSGNYQEMIDLAKKLNLVNYDKWLIACPAVDPTKELAEYYQASDLVIQASLEEGLGLSPLEALACEIPIIVSKVGGLAAHLNEYGEFFRAGDAQDLKNKIENFKTNPSPLLLKANAGRQYVLQNWSQEIAYNSIKKVISNN